MELEREFNRQLRKLELKKGSICLLALSGGLDSISLLWLCSAVKDLWPFTLHAARVAHNIRDEETEERENHFCSTVCAEHAIPFEVLNISPGVIKDLHRETGYGIEATARRLRYKKLQQQVEKLSADIMFTAHTANDQLETILMRVFSGSGPEGMVGIPQKNGIIRRPLLGLSRESLRLYLKSKDGIWVEDETNALPIYTRNKIRNELLPMLKKIFPGCKSTLHTLAERAANSSKALDSIGQEKLPMIIDGTKRKWDARQWRLTPFYLQALALWKAFDDLCKGSGESLPWAVVKSVLAAIENQKNWRGYGLELKYSEEMVIIGAIPVADLDCWSGRLVFSREDILNGKEFHIGPVHVRVSLTEFSKSKRYTVFEWPFIVNFSIKRSSFYVKKIKNCSFVQELPDNNSESVHVSALRELSSRELQPDIPGESIYISMNCYKEEKSV